MFLRARQTSLSRRRCLTRLSSRADPLARPVSPRLRALAVNKANSGTGSGELHSPFAHARYQPIDPEVTRRTSAYQLLSRTTATGPSVLKPIRRRVPSG